jgi:hypothetical protein
MASFPKAIPNIAGIVIPIPKENHPFDGGPGCRASSGALPVQFVAKFKTSRGDAEV